MMVRNIVISLVGSSGQVGYIDIESQKHEQRFEFTDADKKVNDNNKDNNNNENILIHQDKHKGEIRIVVPKGMEGSLEIDTLDDDWYDEEVSFRHRGYVVSVLNLVLVILVLLLVQLLITGCKSGSFAKLSSLWAPSR